MAHTKIDIDEVKEDGEVIGYHVIVDYHYYFSFYYDKEGVLGETSSGCDGSERDEKMMRSMRRYALAALEAAGHMHMRLTRELITLHQ